MAAITISAPATYPRVSLTRPAPVRLTRRGRRLARTALVLLALLTVLVVGLINRAPAQAGDAAAVSATSTVVVQPGQTMWSIAQSVAPNADVRETIARIATLNGLEGGDVAAVVPGQKLVIPAKG